MASYIDLNATFEFGGLPNEMALAASGAFSARGIPESAYDMGPGMGPCCEVSSLAYLLPPCLEGTAPGWEIDPHFRDTLRIVRPLFGLPVDAERAAERAAVEAAARRRAAVSDTRDGGDGETDASLADLLLHMSAGGRGAESRGAGESDVDGSSAAAGDPATPAAGRAPARLVPRGGVRPSLPAVNKDIRAELSVEARSPHRSPSAPGLAAEPAFDAAAPSDAGGTPATALRLVPHAPQADPQSSSDQMRDSKALVELRKSTTASMACLTAARRRFQGIDRALRDRFADGRSFGFMGSLPAVVLSTLADAQLHQIAIYLAVRDSVRRHSASMGASAARLLAAFSDDTQFAMSAKPFVRSSAVACRMALVEFVGGVIPVGYLALCMVMAWRPRVDDTRGPAIEAIAVSTQIMVAGRLDISHGARKLIAAWHVARQDDRPFPTTALHGAILRFIQLSAEAKCPKSVIDWEEEVYNLELATQRRGHAAAARHQLPQYTWRETADLMDWLIEVGLNIENENARHRECMSFTGSGSHVRAASSGGGVISGAVADETLSPARPVTHSASPALPAACLAWTAAQWVHPQHTAARLYHAAFAARGVRAPPLEGIPALGRVPTEPCWTPGCSHLTLPTWVICHGCMELNPLAAVCTRPSCGAPPFVSARCPECSRPHRQCALISSQAHLIAPAKIAACALSPYPTCLRRFGEHHQPPSSVADAVVAPRATHSTFEATADICHGPCPPILAGSAVEAHGWSFVIPPLQDPATPKAAFLYIDGVATVTLHQGPKLGEHFLELVPYRDPSAPSLTSWTFFDAARSDHLRADIWTVLFDTGANNSIVCNDDASKLANLDSQAYPSVLSFEGSPVRIVGRGSIRIVAQSASDPAAFRRFSAKFLEAMALAPTGNLASGPGPNVIRRLIARDDELDSTILPLPPEWDPSKVSAADRRAGVFPSIVDPATLSDRLNIRHRPTLLAYSDLAGGVRKFAKLPPELPIDLLVQKAVSRRPPIKSIRNAFSWSIQLKQRPGDVFWSDLNQRQLPDIDGFQFSRTGMDDASGRVLLSWSQRADTESLLSHFEDLTRSAVRYRGYGPSVFRMDFAAEAMVQGRGDNAHTLRLSQWLDEHPGVRVLATAPHSPEHNRVEPTQGRIHALALLNHLRSHVGRAGWRFMEMGAAYQLNHHPRTGHSRTREHEFTGLDFDASRLICFCGQGGFTHRDDAKASALRLAAEPCLYIHPSELSTGQVVLLLNRLRLFVVRSMTPLPGTAVLGALAASALHGPGHAPIDLSASDHTKRIQALFAPFEGDVNLSAVRYNEFSGVPEEVTLMAPMLDEDGELCIVPAYRASGLAAASAEASEGVASPSLAPSVHPAEPAGADFVPFGDVAARELLRTGDVLALDPATRMFWLPNGKEHKHGTAPSASRTRYLAYRGARTISEFFSLHPSSQPGPARADLLNDLRVGLALVHAGDLARAAPRIAAVRTTSAATAIERFRSHIASRPPLRGEQRRLIEAIGDVDASLEQFYGMVAVEGLSPAASSAGLDALSMDLITEASYRLFPTIGIDSRWLSQLYPTDHAFGESPEMLSDYRSLSLSAVASADSDAGDDPTGCVPSESTHWVRGVTAGSARDPVERPDARGRVRPTRPAPIGVRAAEAYPDYAGPGGWGESINKQIRQVESFNAWIPVSHSTFLATKARLDPSRITIAALLLIFRYKTDGDGYALPGGGLKSRCAIAPQSAVPASVLTYSATADDLTDRVVVCIAHDEEDDATTADVICAYFQGKPPSEAEGGQQVFVRIPSWLKRYGPYPDRDERNRPCWLHVVGNFPGLATAGPCWQRRYDAFLLKLGFRQCVVDRRLFFFVNEHGRLMLLIHVDDTRIYFSSSGTVFEWFMRLWTKEFGSPPPASRLDTNFCGVNRHQWNARTTVLSAGAVFHALELAVRPFPLLNGEQCRVPMTANAPRELRRGGGPDDIFVPEHVALARSLCGMAGFIVARVRPDGNFAFCLLSKYMGARLTLRAWRHLLRFVWYLVSTADLPLVLYSDTSVRPTRGSRTPFVIAAFTDSSHGDAEDGGAHGGFVIVRMSGSPPRPTATLAWKTMVIDGVDSTGAQELAMLCKCYRWILGVRALINDADTGSDPNPTALWTDASVVINQDEMDKVNKDSRWIACRLAMLRYGQDVRAIKLLKIAGEDNLADILTKPLQGEQFFKLRDLLLGLSHLGAHNPEAPLRSGPTWST